VRQQQHLWAFYGPSKTPNQLQIERRDSMCDGEDIIRSLCDCIFAAGGSVSPIVRVRIETEIKQETERSLEGLADELSSKQAATISRSLVAVDNIRAGMACVFSIAPLAILIPCTPSASLPLQVRSCCGCLSLR
jgi:hypothetical protein